MAFWVVGGGSPLCDNVSSSASQTVAYTSERGAHSGGVGFGGKRRVIYPDPTASGCDSSCSGITKRPRLDDRGRVVGYQGYGGCDYHHAIPDVSAAASEPAAVGPSSQDRNSSMQVKNLAFLVIREREPSPPPTPTPPPPAISPEPRVAQQLGMPPTHCLSGHPHGTGPTGPATMERTISGLSISSDASAVHSPGEEDWDLSGMMSDLSAASLVRRHVANICRRRHRDSQHGRILKALINPKSRDADFPLDNDALRSIFSAANELFFANKLSQRVTWDWSHPTSAQYESHIVGTTALRRSARLGGYETLIVLSSPILKDTKYNRRLLISTFLHEMIHSFLFITCGFKARECGGHTEGFRQIAEIIDDWVGKEHLRLRDMEADLERFIDEEPAAAINDHTLRHHSSGYYAHGNGKAQAQAQAQAQATYRAPEWQYQPERISDYPTIQAPQPRRRLPNLGDWEWHDREGFPTHNVHSAGASYYP